MSILTKSMVKRIIHKLGRETAFYAGKRNILFPANHKIVSFTFDDFPVSAMENGARILEKYHVRGTFYTALGIADRLRPVGKIPSQQEMLSLSENGHEVGCHTFSHLECSFKSADRIRDDCLRNQETAENLADISLQNFAYPHGSFDPWSKSVISDIYATARTIEPGINSGAIDMGLLKSVVLSEQDGGTSALQWLKKLKDKGGWLIFHTHGVTPLRAPFCCTVELLEKTIARCNEMGFRIMTINQTVSLFRK